MIRTFTQKSRLGKTRLWKVWRDGATVHVEYGEEGGKMQHTEDTKFAKNKGRSNEKSPVTVAMEEVERLVKLKLRNGYREVGVDESPANLLIDLNKPLPEGLCFYKPANSMSKFMTGLLEDEELAWAVRKRDGNMMVLHKTMDRKVHMYSRKMLTHMDKEPDRPFTERFAHIAEDFSMCAPRGTIVLGEIVANADKDDFNYVGSVLKSYTDRAIKIQQENGWVLFYVWDIAWWAGEEWLSCEKMGKRLMEASRSFMDCDFMLPPDIWSVEDLEAEDLTKELQNLARKRGWEGFVVINPDGIMDDRAWNLRGKADRPSKVSCKLKPTRETDVILYWDGEYGTGKHQQGVKNLTMHQYNASGELIEVGRVASGLTDAQKIELADESFYPLVAMVEFENWTDKRKLRIPRFIRFHQDKTPEECINNDL